MELIIAVAKPMISANAATVENTCAIKALTDVMTENKEEHGKIWDKLGEHDGELRQHGEDIAALKQQVR